MNVNVMSKQRVIEIMQCYGASEAAWPESERDAAVKLLADSDELQRLKCEAQALDQILHVESTLESEQANSVKVSDDVVNNLLDQLPIQVRPASNSTNHQAGMGADQYHGFNMSARFVSAASIIMVFAITLTIAFNTHRDTLLTKAPVVVAQSNDHALDQWLWGGVEDDVDDADDSLTFMAFVDLDLTENNI